jgi:uncharacterized membrane protein YgcG
MTEGKKCCGMKILLAVVAFGLIGFGSGMLWHVFEAAWNTPEMKPIWRPMDSQAWKWMPLAYAVQAIVFVVLFLCLGKALSCCKCNFLRGAKFGFKLWLIVSFSGTFFWFITENITMDVVVLALATQFLTFVIGGAIVGKIIGDPSCTSSTSSCDKEESKGSCGTEKPAGSCGAGKNHCAGSSSKNHCGSHS